MSLIKTPNGINLQIANVTPDDRGKSMWKMQGKLPRDAYYNSTTPFSSFLALGFLLQRGVKILLCFSVPFLCPCFCLWLRSFFFRYFLSKWKWQPLSCHNLSWRHKLMGFKLGQTTLADTEKCIFFPRLGFLIIFHPLFFHPKFNYIRAENGIFPPLLTQLYLSSWGGFFPFFLISLFWYW